MKKLIAIGALVALIGVISVFTLLRWLPSRQGRGRRGWGRPRQDGSDVAASQPPIEGTRSLPDEYRARLEEEIRGEE